MIDQLEPIRTLGLPGWWIRLTLWNRAAQELDQRNYQLIMHLFNGLPTFVTALLPIKRLNTSQIDFSQPSKEKFGHINGLKPISIALVNDLLACNKAIIFNL